MPSRKRERKNTFPIGTAKSFFTELVTFLNFTLYCSTFMLAKYMMETGADTEATNDDSTVEQYVVVGITGGIGSGKSTVAERIAAKGYPVLSTDATAKKLMSSNGWVKSELRSLLGDEAYSADGLPNNAYIAAKVFGSSRDASRLLEELNRIVHPLVLETIQEEIGALFNGGATLVFVESALMYEVGLDDAFDYILGVLTNEELRLQRAMARGLSKEQVQARMDEQLTNNELKNRVDFVIENNGTVEELYPNVDFLLDIISFLPPRPVEEDEDEESES